MKTMASYAQLDELRSLYADRQNAIRCRLGEFAAVPEEEYFYELVYCLLTPQSSAVNAAKAVEALKRARLHSRSFDPAPLLHHKEFYIRFHNTKARHITELKEMFPLVLDHLRNGSTPTELRAWVAGTVPGVGWKEASHFLRNIGYRNLAILDRHILKNLKRHGVIRSLPATLTPKRYLAIERRFARFADAIGISMDELDLLFWSRETGEILK